MGTEMGPTGRPSERHQFRSSEFQKFFVCFVWLQVALARECATLCVEFALNAGPPIRRRRASRAGATRRTRSE